MGSYSVLALVRLPCKNSVSCEADQSLILLISSFIIHLNIYREKYFLKNSIFLTTINIAYIIRSIAYSVY